MYEIVTTLGGLAFMTGGGMPGGWAGCDRHLGSRPFTFEGRIGRARFWALNGLRALSLVPAYFAILFSVNRSNAAAFVLVVFGVFVSSQRSQHS